MEQVIDPFTNWPYIFTVIFPVKLQKDDITQLMHNIRAWHTIMHSISKIVHSMDIIFASGRHSREVIMRELLRLKTLGERLENLFQTADDYRLKPGKSNAKKLNALIQHALYIAHMNYTLIATPGMLEQIVYLADGGLMMAGALYAANRPLHHHVNRCYSSLKCGN
jgi:hypothetical protein